jgi:hypothetical protein
VEFREDLITWVCLELNTRALVSSWKVENLDAMNGGWLGVFIAPTTKLGRWVPIVGALTSGPAWMSGGAPDMHCRVSGAPLRACLTPARSGAHLMPLQVTVGAR